MKQETKSSSCHLVLSGRLHLKTNESKIVGGNRLVLDMPMSTTDSETRSEEEACLLVDVPVQALRDSTKNQSLVRSWMMAEKLERRTDRTKNYPTHDKKQLQKRRLVKKVLSLASGTFPSKPFPDGVMDMETYHPKRQYWLSKLLPTAGNQTPKLLNHAVHKAVCTEKSQEVTQLKTLLSGQLTQDSTVQIRTKVTKLSSPSEMVAIPTLSQKELPGSTSRRGCKSRNDNVTEWKSLGTFDFPQKTQSQSHVKRPTSKKSLFTWSFPPLLFPLGSSGIGTRSSKVSPQSTRGSQDAHLSHWKNLVEQRTRMHGPSNPKTLQAKMELGNVFLQSKDYAAAEETFQIIVLELKKRQSSCKLLLAAALEKLGCSMTIGTKATSKYSNNKEKRVMDCLEESFQIRYKTLGPNHVDTVESLNAIASVHVQWKEWYLACQAYHEVWVVRQAIFGPQHASVAVVRHKLGQVYERLADPLQARVCYQQAEAIFVQDRHAKASLASVRADIAALDHHHAS